MDAILVKYHGPTNVRGSRMIATIAKGTPSAKSVTRVYDSELSMAQNARACAKDLISELPYNHYMPIWGMGNLGEDYVFVAHPSHARKDPLCIDTRSWAKPI